jgi:hypothetical protein
MKILILFIAFILLSTSTLAATATSISGTVSDSNNQGVIDATVTVNCEHNGINTTKVVQTDSNGEYYSFYPALQCNVADKVYVLAEIDTYSNTGQGIVAYDQTCQINTAFVNISIPEFGIIAGSVALIGLVAGVAIMRRKNE